MNMRDYLLSTFAAFSLSCVFVYDNNQVSDVCSNIYVEKEDLKHIELNGSKPATMLCFRISLYNKECRE
jgi:hypothetical protein